MITKSDIDVDQLFNDVDENVVMKALDGFLIVLSNDGDVVYASENIHDFIGIQQVCTTNSFNSLINRIYSISCILFFSFRLI